MKSLSIFFFSFLLSVLFQSGISVSIFTLLVDVPVSITSSTAGLKISAITAGIKKYKSIIKKKNKKHNKIALLAQK